jgi:hypothetical protein
LDDFFPGGDTNGTVVKLNRKFASFEGAANFVIGTNDSLGRLGAPVDELISEVVGGGAGLLFHRFRWKRVRLPFKLIQIICLPFLLLSHSSSFIHRPPS